MGDRRILVYPAGFHGQGPCVLRLRDGVCCARVRVELARPVASREGVGPRASATIVGARDLEVTTGHVGLAPSIPGWTAVAEAVSWG